MDPNPELLRENVDLQAQVASLKLLLLQQEIEATPNQERYKQLEKSVADALVSLRKMERDHWFRLTGDILPVGYTRDSGFGSSKIGLSTATAALHYNLSSFAKFITSYINGRQQHTRDALDRKFKAMLLPYFAEPEDLLQVSGALVLAACEVNKMEAEEGRGLVKHIDTFLNDVVKALIHDLEEVLPCAI